MRSPSTGGLVLVKRKHWKLGRGIQRRLLLGTTFISFGLFIFTFQAFSSFCSFPLLQICCVSALAFSSFCPWLKGGGGKNRQGSHMLITAHYKNKKLYCCFYTGSKQPTWWWRNAHMGTRACSLKLHPVTYNHYWQHASLWPAGSFPPRAPSFSLSRHKRKRFSGRNGARMNHQAWCVQCQQHTHTHTLHLQCLMKHCH